MVQCVLQARDHVGFEGTERGVHLADVVVGSWDLIRAKNGRERGHGTPGGQTLTDRLTFPLTQGGIPVWGSHSRNLGRFGEMIAKPLGVMTRRRFGNCGHSCQIESNLATLEFESVRGDFPKNKDRQESTQ